MCQALGAPEASTDEAAPSQMVPGHGGTTLAQDAAAERGEGYRPPQPAKARVIHSVCFGRKIICKQLAQGSVRDQRP